MSSINLPYHTTTKIRYSITAYINDHKSTTGTHPHKTSGTRVYDATQWVQLNQGSCKVVLFLLYSNFPGEYKSTCMAIYCGGESGAQGKAGHSIPIGSKQMVVDPTIIQLRQITIWVPFYPRVKAQYYIPETYPYLTTKFYHILYRVSCFIDDKKLLIKEIKMLIYITHTTFCINWSIS